MPTDDVVAELDRWLDVTSGEPDEQWLAERPMVQRARAEIVALREMRDAHVRILSARLDEDEENMRRWIAKARNEALEEAARVCDRLGLGVLDDGAAAIRALKKNKAEPQS